MRTLCSRNLPLSLRVKIGYKKSTMQTIVAGNWKMNGSQQTISSLLQILQQEVVNMATEVIVFPPFVYVPLVAEFLRGSQIAYGGQTLSEQQVGAYTGEVAGSMLQDYGCKYVILGHSERRLLFAESNAMVAKKFAMAQRNGLIPLLCVGETLAQREAEQTITVITAQLQGVIDVVGIDAFAKAVIAYEPVWAIGTGITATPKQAQTVHAAIRAFLAKKNENVAMDLSLLYGGSVKAHNAMALTQMPDINGVLVGGASLDAHAFVKIIEAFQH